MNRVRLLVCLCVVGAAVVCGGCAQSPAWGREATALPGWTRLRRAAVSAATDPQTWAPLAGAALLQIGDVDQEIANWAADETPLFGTRGRADTMSDVWRDLTKVAWATTFVATPSSRCLPAGLWGKAKGGAVEGIALWIQGAAVGELKDASARRRPDASGTDSFPSAHTSDAAAFSALARRHVEAMHLRPHEKCMLDASFTALTGLTAWSRVEAGRHYPSDVLVGWSLGNFVSLFLHDAFIGRRRGDPRLVFAPDPEGLRLSLTLDQ